MAEPDELGTESRETKTNRSRICSAASSARGDFAALLESLLQSTLHDEETVLAAR